LQSTPNRITHEELLAQVDSLQQLLIDKTLALLIAIISYCPEKFKITSLPGQSLWAIHKYSVFFSVGSVPEL
jgi:hypothetical protein